MIWSLNEYGSGLVKYLHIQAATRRIYFIDIKLPNYIWQHSSFRHNKSQGNKIFAGENESVGMIGACVMQQETRVQDSKSTAANLTTYPRTQALVMSIFIWSILARILEPPQTPDLPPNHTAQSIFKKKRKQSTTPFSLIVFAFGSVWIINVCSFRVWRLSKINW